MKSKLLVAFVLGIGLLAVCGPAVAHHGNVAYENKVIEFKQATVTKFLWSNPHSLIDFDVKDDKGNVVHWAGEMNSPGVLKAAGWSKTTLKPGDQVTLSVRPNKAGTPVGLLSRASLIVNGKPLQIGPEQ
jgi:uncharacterized cupredoxin-like copper-binding protein